MVILTAILDIFLKYNYHTFQNYHSFIKFGALYQFCSSKYGRILRTFTENTWHTSVVHKTKICSPPLTHSTMMVLILKGMYLKQ